MDNELREYAQLAGYLNGRGVPNMEEALREVFLLPIHHPFKELVNADFFRKLHAARVTEPFGFLNEELLDAMQQKMVRLLRALRQFSGGTGDEEVLALETRRRLETSLQLPVVESWYEWPADTKTQAALKYLKTAGHDELFPWSYLFGWIVVHSLGRIVGDADVPQRSRSWLDEWLLSKIIGNTLRDLKADDTAASQGVRLVGLLTSNQRWFEMEGPEELRAYRTLESLLKDGDGQQFLGINRYEEIVWFNGESFEELLWWLYVAAVIQICVDPSLAAAEVSAALVEHHKVIDELRQAAEKSEYQVEVLLELVKG